MRVCVCVCERERERVCVTERVGGGGGAIDSVSARVMCFSVYQFRFALHDYKVCVVTCCYAIDFCVSIYAFHAFVSLNGKALLVAKRAAL